MRDDERRRPEQDRERQAVAYQGLERAAGEDTPLRQPARHRPVDHVVADRCRAPPRWRTCPDASVIACPGRRGDGRARRRSSTPNCSSASSSVPTKPTRPPAHHEHDAIALREVLDRVRGEHDRRRTVGELTEAVDDLRARDRVEARCRLVEEEHVRIGEQLDGDAGALALPAAQATRPGRRRMRSGPRRRARHGLRRRSPSRLVDDGRRSRAA